MIIFTNDKLYVDSSRCSASIHFNRIFFCAFYYYYYFLRYMASELLTTNIRLGSADIFSLGMTIFELCCATSSAAMNDHSIFDKPALFHPHCYRPHQSSQLPQSGPAWHLLRHDGLCDVTARYIHNPALRDIINACMRDQFALRPTASELLLKPQVASAGLLIDNSFVYLISSRAAREKEAEEALCLASDGRSTPTANSSSMCNISYGSSAGKFLSRSDSATDFVFMASNDNNHNHHDGNEDDDNDDYKNESEN